MDIYSLNIEKWLENHFKSSLLDYNNIEDINNCIFNKIINKSEKCILLVGFYNSGNFTKLGNLMDFIENLVMAKKIEKIIYMSSFGVYKPKFEGIYSENDKLEPQNKIGFDSLILENFFTYINSKYKTDIKILRTFSIYGPFLLDESLIPNILRTFIFGKEIYVGDTKKVRDFLYIDDLLRLINKMISLENSENINIYNAGTTVSTSIRDLIKLVEKISNKKPNVIFDPSKIRSDYDYDYVVADMKKIKDEFKWEPSVSLEEGLRLTYLWNTGRGF